LIEEIEKSPQVVVNHIVFSSPNQKSVKIKLIADSFNGISSGYVCRRMVYDNILFQAAREKVETIEGFTVEDVIKPNGRVQGVKGRFEDGREKEFTANVVVGADGFNSVILRKLELYDHDPDHLLVATRAYYSGVTGLSDAIELHYIREVLPGYFWIFPLENGMANVGLGMIHSALKKKGVRLRSAHIAATEAPVFKERFKNARLIGDIQGWNLPVGSKRRRMHGDGFMLVGDAAGLIDPFTGEGIGNAMCSGKIAAQTIAEIGNAKDYSANRLKIYSDTVWRTLGGELNLAYRLQRTARFTPLVNLVVNRASKRQEVADWISAMIAGKISKRELVYPSTYVKLLLK
jgi:geranylgeranyl reductase family protein